MFGHCKEMCKGLKCDMDNQGEKLVITIDGNKEQIAHIEKKLGALKTLFCSGDDCCS